MYLLCLPLKRITLSQKFPTHKQLSLATSMQVQNKEWLRSSRTNPQDRAAEAFAVSNSLTYLIKGPTYFPRVSRNNPSRLDLFFTIHHEPYQASVAASLRNSDHGLISVFCPVQSTLEECLPLVPSGTITTSIGTKFKNFILVFLSMMSFPC